MKEIFLILLNTCINSSWLVLAVILARLIFKKAPKSFTCLLWALVGIRLLIPASLTSPLSLVPVAEPIEQELYSVNASTYNTAKDFTPSITPSVPLRVQDNTEYVTDDKGDSVVSDNNAQVAPTGVSVYGDTADVKPYKQSLFDLAWKVWLAGVALFFVYSTVCYLRIYIRSRESIMISKGVWLCDRISSPCILGVFKPRIMLPSGLFDEDREYVVLHERAHLSGLDHVWKFIAFVLLIIYWYNLLLWLAFYLFAKDIEYACDERVIREQGDGIKRQYSLALINCSASAPIAFASPLAFSEKRLAGRLKNIINYKKPAVWICVSFALVTLIIVLCFMTVPADADESSSPIEQTWEKATGYIETESSSEKPTDEVKQEEKDLGYSVVHTLRNVSSNKDYTRENAEKEKTYTFEGKTYELTYDYTNGERDYYSDYLDNIFAFDFDGEIVDFFMSFTDFTNSRTPGVKYGSDAISDEDILVVADETIVRIFGDRVNGMVRVDMSSETITDMNTLIRTVSYQKFYGENGFAAGDACSVTLMPKGELYYCYLSVLEDFDESLLDGIHKEDIDAQIDLQMAELYKDVEGFEYEIKTPSVREDENGYFLRIVVKGSYPDKENTYNDRGLELKMHFTEIFEIRLG